MRIQQYKIGRPGCLEHMIATYHDGKLNAYFKNTEWWKHLRGLGYEPVKNGRGDITKWTRKIVALVFLLWALLLSSCMTPKKMDRWLTKNPDFFKTERDTQQVLTPFPIEISVPLPVDTSTWTWTVSGDLDTNLLFETKRLKGELAIFQDTLLRVNVPPTQPRRRLNLDIQVKPDTIVVRDTLQVPCPTETKTRTVILKYRWKDWLIWILVGALIITIGGRTWLKQK